MRNLSPLGAIHSPIDADRDATAYSTDFAKLGLPDHSPFAILSKPRAQINTGTAPKKRGPKARTQRERIIASLQDIRKPDQSDINIVSRAERQKRERESSGLTNPRPNHFNTDIPSREESDRTLAMQGRRLV